MPLTGYRNEEQNSKSGHYTLSNRSSTGVHSRVDVLISNRVRDKTTRLLEEAYDKVIKFPKQPTTTTQPTKSKGNKVAQFPAQSELSVPVYPRDDKYFAGHGATEAINYVKQQLGNCSSVFGIWARESSDNTWKKVSRREVTRAKSNPEKYNELCMYDDFWVWDNNKKFDINMRNVWEAMVERENDELLDQTGKNNINTAKKRAYEQLKKLIFRFKASKEYKDCIGK